MKNMTMNAWQKKHNAARARALTAIAKWAEINGATEAEQAEAQALVEKMMDSRGIYTFIRSAKEMSDGFQCEVKGA